MADKVGEMDNRKIYGLVYSRGTTGRFKPYEIAKDDELNIRSLPKEMMKKVYSRRCNGARYRAKESLSEHCSDGIKVEGSTELITMKGNSKAGSSKQKESKINKGVCADIGRVVVDTVEKENNNNINTLVNVKRGADGEIVRAYILSPHKSLSKLRPRKEIPAFRMVNLEEDDYEVVVGKRVKVYWSGSRRWFMGHIVSFDNKNRLHTILYDDGDKEVLELRKERFEVEVMPTDHFKLKSESNPTRKADGLDTADDSEAMIKANSRNVSAALVTKVSEYKQKMEATKEGERTSSKTQRKNTEVTVDDLVSNMDEIPKKVGEVVTTKVSDMERSEEARFEEDPEAPKEACREFEAEETIVESYPEFWRMESENSGIKEHGTAVDDESLKISIAELASKSKVSTKGLMPKAKKMRTNKAFSREFGNIVKKPDINVKSHCQCDEAKTTQMDAGAGFQSIIRKNEALSNKSSDGDETSNEASYSTLDPVSKNQNAVEFGCVCSNAANEVENLTKSVNRTAEDVVSHVLLNPCNVKDERKILATQMELVTSIKEGEGEFITTIHFERLGDADSMNTNHEAESILEAETLKSCDASLVLQPIIHIIPEESKPNTFQAKVKLENGESDKELMGWTSVMRDQTSKLAVMPQINDEAAS